MPSMRFVALLLLMSLVAACASPRVAPDPTDAGAPPPYTLERFRDEAKIAEGVRVLAFDNPYGEIQVRQTSAAAIAWQGVEQRIGTKPRIAQVLPYHQGDHQGVRIRYPGVDPSAPANPRLGRVDLYVFIPSGYLVDVKSDFGQIVVRRIKDDVRARSRSGMITVASRGAVDAESVTGEIRAFTMQGLTATPTRLKTGGNIIADIPLFDDLTVEADSGGTLRANFPISQPVKGSNQRSASTWKNGSGKHRMVLRADGDIVLQALRSPLP